MRHLCLLAGKFYAIQCRYTNPLTRVTRFHVKNRFLFALKKTKQSFTITNLGSCTSSCLSSLCIGRLRLFLPTTNVVGTSRVSLHWKRVCSFRTWFAGITHIEYWCSPTFPAICPPCKWQNISCCSFPMPRTSMKDLWFVTIAHDSFHWALSLPLSHQQIIEREMTGTIV